MKTIRKIVPDDFNLFLFGDMHEGSMMMSKRAIRETFQKMNQPAYGLMESANFGVDHGDCIEAIATDDPRYEVDTTDVTPIDLQIDGAVDRRKKVGKKIITILKGNHEHKLSRVTNATQRICRGLGVEYGTYSAIIEYIDEDGGLLFKHFATHGYGSINSVADDPVRADVNKKLILKRKLKNKFGDTLLNSMGHTHKLLILRPEPILYLSTDQGKIVQRYTEPKRVRGYIEPNHRWYVNTGSFLKLYKDGIDGYAERANLDPVELGYAVVLVRDRKITEIVKERV